MSSHGEGDRLQSSLEPRAVATDERGSGAFAYVVWLPVLAFIVAAVVLSALRIQGVRESVALFATLNALLNAGAGLLAAYLAARTYLLGGSRVVLAFGSGAAVFGLVSLVAGLTIGKPNQGITIGNTGYLVAGAGFTLSAIWALVEEPGQTGPRPATRPVTLTRPARTCCRPDHLLPLPPLFGARRPYWWWRTRNR